MDIVIFIFFINHIYPTKEGAKSKTNIVDTNNLSLGSSLGIILSKCKLKSL